MSAFSITKLAGTGDRKSILLESAMTNPCCFNASLAPGDRSRPSKPRARPAKALAHDRLHSQAWCPKPMRCAGATGIPADGATRTPTPMSTKTDRSTSAERHKDRFSKTERSATRFAEMERTHRNAGDLAVSRPFRLRAHGEVARDSAISSTYIRRKWSPSSRPVMG